MARAIIQQSPAVVSNVRGHKERFRTRKTDILIKQYKEEKLRVEKFSAYAFPSWVRRALWYFMGKRPPPIERKRRLVSLIDKSLERQLAYVQVLYERGEHDPWEEFRSRVTL